MNKKIVLAALLAATAPAFVSCAGAPVMNITDESLMLDEGATPSLSEVTDAIRRAGHELGWAMQLESEGKMIGVLHVRTHMAKVEILFDTRSFSINYVDSQNLRYNGSTIHRNYNSWVANLSRKIVLETQLLEMES
jgi:hypothetical protein